MKIGIEDFKKRLLSGTPFLDVRAQVEFEEGHIPGALNIPILENEERALVGTTYKQQGQDAAVALGYQMVSGPVREQRIQAWQEFFKQSPHGILYCFRGGLRSQITQKWLREVGVEKARLDGGYKKARQYFLESLNTIPDKMSLLVLSGPTGSGKSRLLRKAQKVRPALDLEALANHRGSAFGFEPQPQPSQSQFENEIAKNLIMASELQPESSVLIEDESRMIGRRVMPEALFAKLRDSSILWIDETLEQRVQNIFEDYILNTAIGEKKAEEARALFQKYEQSLTAISKKLGGARTQEIMSHLRAAQEIYFSNGDLELNRSWIEQLLIYYYDPLYLGSLERRNPKIALRGSSREIFSYLIESSNFNVRSAIP